MNSLKTILSEISEKQKIVFLKTPKMYRLMTAGSKDTWKFKKGDEFKITDDIGSHYRVEPIKYSEKVDPERNAIDKKFLNDLVKKKIVEIY